MPLEKIMDYLGTLGIIGSLIFVGLELQQSHTIALAGQIQARNQMAADLLLAPLEGNMNLYKVWGGAIQGETEAEILRSVLLNHRALTTTNAWQQYQLGLLSDEVWRQVEQRQGNGWKRCSGNRVEFISQYTESLIDYAFENWSSEKCIEPEEL